MTKQEMFEIWAPPDNPWSVWAKPSLFDQSRLWREGGDGDPWRGADTNWAPDPSEHTALILDLPGAASVLLGLALAVRGYRPVPLYNCSTGFSEVVAAENIANHLERGAHDLKLISIAANAPPAFLLDSTRSAGRKIAGPGDLDNRWMVFPQDFPSANFLISEGIRGVLLAQIPFSPPLNDLAHVLFRWQKAGIYLSNINPADHSAGRGGKLVVTRPSQFRALWYRAIAAFGLKRNSAGGFGSVIPDPSSSGGGYYGGRFRGGFG